MLDGSLHSGWTLGAALILATGSFLPAGSSRASAQTEISDPAYPLPEVRVAANQTTFFVHEDADTGFNHGSASALFASGNPADFVALDAVSLDDPAAATGCSSDPTRLDTQRGTVLRISFDFTPGFPPEFAGVNVEEPENWVGHRGPIVGVYSLRFPLEDRLDFSATAKGSRPPTAKAMGGTLKRSTPRISKQS